MAFSSNSNVKLSGSFSSGANFGLAQQRVDKTYSLALANGTGANQADIQYAQTVSIASGATFDIDLTSFTDAFGTSRSAAEVVQASFYSQADNTTDVSVGGTAARYTGIPEFTLVPGGVMIVNAPDADGLGAVTDGTDDNIRLTNGSGASATVEIYIAARSA